MNALIHLLNENQHLKMNEVFSFMCYTMMYSTAISVKIPLSIIYDLPLPSGNASSYVINKLDFCYDAKNHSNYKCFNPDLISMKKYQHVSNLLYYNESNYLNSSNYFTNTPIENDYPDKYDGDHKLYKIILKDKVDKYYFNEHYQHLNPEIKKAFSKNHHFYVVDRHDGFFDCYVFTHEPPTEIEHLFSLIAKHEVKDGVVKSSFISNFYYKIPYGIIKELDNSKETAFLKDMTFVHYDGKDPLEKKLFLQQHYLKLLENQNEISFDKLVVTNRKTRDDIINIHIKNAITNRDSMGKYSDAANEVIETIKLNDSCKYELYKKQGVNALRNKITSLH